MKQKKIKINKKILVITICIVLFSLLFIRFVLHQKSAPINKPNPIPTSTQNFTNYHSDFFAVSLEIPKGYSIKEQPPEVLFEKDGQVIAMHIVSKNKIYKSIDEFLDDKFNTDVEHKKVVRKHMTIHGLDAVEVTAEYPNASENDNKAYYFYINNGFYHLYTVSPTLYSDLDHITASFRYESVAK
jgi:predicted Zn-dependent protease